MKRILFFLILQFIFYIQSTSAQNQYYFTHFTTEDGLSQSTVFSIVQDDFGFMWFATEDGLNKFDGNKFTIFRHDPDDSTSLSDLGIRKIYKDKSGILWILTLNGGLNKFIPEKNCFTRYSFKKNKDNISGKIITLTEDAQGNLWAATTKGEFFIYNKKKNLFIYKKLNKSIEEFFGTTYLQTVFGAKDGTLWIGTWKGLLNLNPKNLKIEWYNKGSLKDDIIFNFAEDDSGDIWAASANGGIIHCERNKSKFKFYKNNSGRSNSISSNRIMSILVDSRKKIWIGTLDKGLDLFDPGTKTFTNFSHNPSIEASLSIGAAMSLCEDKNGGIWIGTGGGGINRYDPLNQNFSFIQNISGNPLSISPNAVLAICEDHLGNLWIGSDGGGLNLKENNSNEFITFLKSPSFGSNAVTAICEDKNGDIWIGTDPGTNSPAGALIKFNRKNRRFLYIKNLSIKIGGITAIHPDNFGNLWITTPADGVHYYNPASKEEIIFRYDQDNNQSIASNSIFSIFEDSKGDLWFGSISSGLSRFNRKTNSFTRFQNDPKDKTSLSSNSVWCITEDSDNNLWIGTWGFGLNKYIREKNCFERFSVDNGLPGNLIYSILPDDYGNIWIGSNKGLTKFNHNTGTCISYNKSNGMLINDFSAGAVFKTKDGRLYFGGNNGVILFDPQKVIDNTFIPKIVITDFRVFDKPFKSEKSLPYTNEINLDYDQNFFTIEFASLDYTAQKKNLFEYKLEGVDIDWIKSSERRFASYTDLSSGKYKFKVRGTNSSGIFNPEEASINITISPAFWNTWWFRLFILTGIILILYLFHKYRLNRLLEVEKTRNKIARDLHDEVSAGITGIVYFADAVKREMKEKETPAFKKLIGLISESAGQIQESMSDIIWSINPDNDDWNIVLPKLRRYTSDLCESKEIKYELEIPEKFFGKSLKMEQRHDLWLIYKEIITNSVKHSGGTKIKVKLCNDTDFIYMQISDDGIGFNPDNSNSNNGLKNIRSRSKTLGATTELFTSGKKGTEWRIKIPITAGKKK